MLKELLFKLFGKSESPPWRAAEHERSNSAKSLPAEQQAVTLYIATTASGTLMKRYIVKQLQRRPVLNHAADENALTHTTYGAQPIPVDPLDISQALVPEADKLPDAFKDMAQARQRLLGLAQSRNPETRLAIAENPATTADVLDLLAADDEADVRYAAAANLNCPEPALQSLSHDENSYVSHRASQTLKHRSRAAAGIAHGGEPGSAALDCSMQDNGENKLGYCQNPETVRWLVMIAEDPATDRDLLEQLSHHEIPDVRIAVTDNPMISLRVLGHLAGDENPDVRFALAENHQMPVPLLEVLAEDDNPYIAHRARRTLSRINSSGILKNQFPFKGDSWRQQRKA